MFFTVLLILWLVFLGLMISEIKLYKNRERVSIDKQYTSIRGGIIFLSLIFTTLYVWNLSRNVNIQNIVMTALMFLVVILSVFIVPKVFKPEISKGLKFWLLFRNSIAVFNTITILVHFIIFTI